MFFSATSAVQNLFRQNKTFTAENAEKTAESRRASFLCLCRSHHQNPASRSRPRFKRPFRYGFTPWTFYFPGKRAHLISAVRARHTQTRIIKAVIHPTINAMHKNLRKKSAGQSSVTLPRQLE